MELANRLFAKLKAGLTMPPADAPVENPQTDWVGIGATDAPRIAPMKLAELAPAKKTARVFQMPLR